jgi:hypothetical protein
MRVHSVFCNPFRMNSYEKQGRGVLLLTSHFDEAGVEEQHGRRSVWQPVAQTFFLCSSLLMPFSRFHFKKAEFRGTRSTARYLAAQAGVCAS